VLVEAAGASGAAAWAKTAAGVISADDRRRRRPKAREVFIMGPRSE
jgi:hypothetical protein